MHCKWIKLARAVQAQVSSGFTSGGMMVRVGSEQHIISEGPHGHMGRTPSEPSFMQLPASPSHRSFSPTAANLPRCALNKAMDYVQHRRKQEERPEFVSGPSGLFVVSQTVSLHKQIVAVYGA
jgi:hypothetical protein